MYYLLLKSAENKAIMETLQNADLMHKVEAAIDQLRPFLQADGGDVELLEIGEDMVAKVRLLGACSTCNISQMTMKAGIEEAVKKAVPQINAVVDINA